MSIRASFANKRRRAKATKSRKRPRSGPKTWNPVRGSVSAPSKVCIPYRYPVGAVAGLLV